MGGYSYFTVDYDRTFFLMKLVNISTGVSDHDPQDDSGRIEQVQLYVYFRNSQQLIGEVQS